MSISSYRISEEDPSCPYPYPSSSSPLLETGESVHHVDSMKPLLEDHHPPPPPHPHGGGGEMMEDESTQKKKFIFSLVCQLHKAGNFSFRTEAYVAQVSTAFHLHATCAVFPVSAIISFQETAILSPQSCEAYNIAIASGYDCSKLSRLDQLCFDIQQGRVDFQSARATLTDIQVAGTYPWYTITIAYGLASFAATLLFFGGNLRDGGWAFFLGLIVNFCGNLCAILPGLSEIECFISPFIVAFVASFLDKFLFDQDLCLYGQLFGGIVWLLPGITITIAVLELFSKMIVYGSSRLIYGILLATQLGFGLSGGYKIIYPEHTLPDSFEDGCHHPLPAVSGVVLLPLAVGSMGIIINADVSQLPGMIFCGGVAYFMSYAFHYYRIASDDAVPVLAALIVTITARLYGHIFQKRPLVYIIGGLLILVPGGMGVRGMSNVWSGNMQSGLEFTFRMVLIGVCLATGVFLALLPRKSWTRAIMKQLSGTTHLKLDPVKKKSRFFRFYDPPKFAKDCDM